MALKLSTTIRMEPEQAARLARLNSVTKAPQAAIIRDGIDLACDAWEARVKAGGGVLPPLEMPAAGGDGEAEGASS